MLQTEENNVVIHPPQWEESEIPIEYTEDRVGGREALEPLDLLRMALEKHHPRVAVACSFQAENSVIIDMLASIRKDVRLFAIDTGRLPEETYELADALKRRYDLKIEWFFPDTKAMEEYLREGGAMSFRESVEMRKRCCQIRKVEPLNRALQGLTAWITGLRREHAETRADLPLVQVDPLHGGIEKYCPLVHWTTEQVWTYIRENGIPYNRLYDQGYASIGCSCCSSPSRPGENHRAGRWRWEETGKKECGLHFGGSGI